MINFYKKKKKKIGHYSVSFLINNHKKDERLKRNLSDLKSNQGKLVRNWSDLYCLFIYGRVNVGAAGYTFVVSYYCRKQKKQKKHFKCLRSPSLLRQTLHSILRVDEDYKLFPYQVVYSSWRPSVRRPVLGLYEIWEIDITNSKIAKKLFKKDESRSNNKLVYVEKSIPSRF